MRWEILTAFDSQICLEQVLPKIIKIGQGILKLQSKMSGMVFLTTVYNYNHEVWEYGRPAWQKAGDNVRSMLGSEET